MSAPFSLHLRYSRLLVLCVVAAHLAPLVAAWLGRLGGVWLAGLLMTVLVSALWQWRQARRLAGLYLRLEAQGAAMLSGPAGEVAVMLQTASRDMGWLVVLVWRDADGRVARATLTRDGVPADDWRRLRRLVRWLPVLAAGDASQAS